MVVSGDGPGARSQTSSIQSAPETCQLQNTDHNLGLSMTVPDLNTENTLTQQVVYSAAAEQFSSRNVAGRHIAVNYTSPAPNEPASFSLPFPGQSKLGAASENVTLSGKNISSYPCVC
jgi:hypothetical protein